MVFFLSQKNGVIKDMAGVDPERGNWAVGEKTTLESVRGVFERWITQPQGGDPRIAALSEATIEIFDTNPLFREAVQFMIEFHEDPDINIIRKIARRAPDRIHPIPLPLYAAHLIRVGYQSELLRLTGIHYPEEFITKEKCLEGWRMILDDQERFDDFSSNIAWRALQTNVADRYKGVKAVIINHQDRFSGPISYLDVGSSLGTGCKKLALGDSFRPIRRTMEWYGDTGLLDSKPMWNDILNRRLTSEVVIGDCVGIDVMPGNDARTRHWIFSCSFYPSELLDSSKVAEIVRLDLANPKNFHGVVRGDFSDKSNIAEMSDRSGQAQFDVISFVTVLSQVKEEDRRLMLKNALEILSPGGLIVIQDFVQASPFGHDGLVFFPDWSKPYFYRTVVIDPSRGDLEPQEALHWQNSRCEELRVSESYHSLLQL